MAEVFVAHLPAGYAVSKLLYRRCDSLEASYPAFMLAGMLGAVAPDFDFAWHYLVDSSRNHHSYFTHFPAFWLAILAVAGVWYREADRRDRVALWCNFALNGFLHLVLDSLVGGIQWLAPFSNQSFSLATIAGSHQRWWLNYLTHWAMLFEVAIFLWAAYLWRGRPRRWLLL
jgi:inner membrane protein